MTSELNQEHIQCGFVLQIDDFFLYRLDDHSMWLEKKGGEGMRVLNNDLKELFSKFWESEF